jgi:hypothetical protein
MAQSNGLATMMVIIFVGALIVFGGVYLALAFGSGGHSTPTPSPTATPTPMPSPTNISTATPTVTPTQNPTATPTQPPTPTPTPTPMPTLIPMPENATERMMFLAAYFVVNDETYRYDGVNGSVNVTLLTDVLGSSADVQVEFDCAHAGYGWRVDQQLNYSITHHFAVIGIRENQTVFAFLDYKWDMLRETAMSR